MTIDTIKTTVEEFIKRLQLPEAKYSFKTNTSSESIEFMILVNGKLKNSLLLTNGSLKVIYDDKYGSLDYISQDFLTPISLVYYLCIFFFTAVSEISDMDFNDLLSIIFMNEIYDWKTLTQGISENLGLTYKKIDNYVTVNDIPIHYVSFTNTIKIDTTEIKLEDSDYCSIVEAIFKCVEYVANLMDVSDNLFTGVEESTTSNLLEEEGEENDKGEEGSMGDSSGGDFNMDIDINESDSEGSPEPVETTENQTFEEPQSAVVEVEDLLE